MGLIRRLYRGETDIEFVGRARMWYLISAVLLVICLASIIFRGFNLGIDFEGGSQFQVVTAGTSVTGDDVVRVVEQEGVRVPSPPQTVGSGSTRSVIVKTENLNINDVNRVREAIEEKLKPDSVNATTVSSSWGEEVTHKAVVALIVFLLLVSLYIAIRFEPRMAVGAIVALLHDLVIAAGIYSIVGFEVTPSTVVGLLTILGFSLYDTVVVFDKVAENTKNITAGSRTTYSEAANLAVNQTLMRSVNTSLISLLPVAGLLFVGAGLLGVGTIEDLALILFVGLAVGAYSSLFLATPIVCTLTERLPAYQALARRVKAKRRVEAERQAAMEADPELATVGAEAERRGLPAPAPRPGARPQRDPRRQTRAKSGPTRRRDR
jgi:preprotein translocase subunit SecF